MSKEKRPYLLRAMHEWMCDNEFTPHIVVDASVDGVEVPQDYVKDGKIILNINSTASANLELSNTHISFQARFNKVPYDILLPVRSVLGIYAKETGAGMIFASADEEQSEDATQCEHVWSITAPIECLECGIPKVRTLAERPGLKVVK